MISATIHRILDFSTTSFEYCTFYFIICARTIRSHFVYQPLYSSKYMENCTVIDLGYKSDNKAFKVTTEIYATEFVQEIC